ncbi:MAG: glycogen/starch synthase [Bacteroidaceae bacterium]|nr:glycogen/starch synthase [Bacteroidaceae bacterium]
MTKKRQQSPDYIFESSWEVCHKVGGIYTVLSSRAKTMQEHFPDKVFFIGPDFSDGKDNPMFTEDATLLSAWVSKAREDDGLRLRAGRWNVPGRPIAILIDFTPFFAERNSIYNWAWENFQVDSLHAYGDYDEASMFAYASAKVAESWYRHNGDDSIDVVYHAHEWMTCLGVLYLQKAVPRIATIFTTHATSIGRSIAGNNKPLYDYLWAYNGDQMAHELNMESKHSIEKQTAWYADCFTTVSDITARECKQLLDTPVDVVLTNGFEDSFVPAAGKPFDYARRTARRKLIQVANTLLGTNMDIDETVIISTGGRYEFKNKGIDMLVDSLNRLRQDDSLNKDVIVFINVPAWIKGPRIELQKRLENNTTLSFPCSNPRITHDLHNQEQDMILSQMNWLDMHNRPDEHLKVIFVPCYLDGHDGIFDMHYYDLLIGNDLCIYPSYYEPWGYTPLESIAFHVPCITTDLAGFGLWASQEGGETGVMVIHRTDSNFIDAAEEIKRLIIDFTRKSPEEVSRLRSSAAHTAGKALWKHFITNYSKAYEHALNARDQRLKVGSKNSPNK